jgi:hypothetical protein
MVEGMRTALVISGQLKRLKEDAPSVIEHIVNPYKADVFISLWSPDYLRLPEVTMKQPYDSSIDELLGYYNPIALELDRPRPLPNVPRNLHNYGGGIATGSKPDNCWSMFYRIHRGNELRKAYEQENGFTYSRVIRFRFEIGACQPCPIIEPEPHTIFIPEGQDHLGGVCDTTAIGDGPSMDVYSSIYSMLNEYSSKCMPTHQESVVRKHLELNGIRIQRFRWGTTLRGKPWNPAY